MTINWLTSLSVNLYCLSLSLGHVLILLLSPLPEVSVIGPHISSHQERMQRNHRLPPLPLVVGALYSLHQVRDEKAGS